MTASATHAAPAPSRLLSLNDVVELTTLSRWTIRRRVREGDFPKPIQISKNRTAWVSADVADWIEAARA